MAVCFEGVLLGIRESLPLLRAARGSVVNVASAAGRKAAAGAAAYCASKAAAIGLTRVAAIELAPLGIRVNCILPNSSPRPRRSRARPSTSPAPTPPS